MIYETNQVDPDNAMIRILEGFGRNKKLNVKSWTMEVYFESEYDDVAREEAKRQMINPIIMEKGTRWKKNDFFLPQMHYFYESMFKSHGCTLLFV